MLLTFHQPGAIFPSDAVSDRGDRASGRKRWRRRAPQAALLCPFSFMSILMSISFPLRSGIFVFQWLAAMKRKKFRASPSNLPTNRSGAF
jgi:hypothetical protein